MTNIIKEHYMRFYTKSGYCVLEIPARNIIEVSVSCESNYMHQRYCGGKKFHILSTCESYMKGMKVCMIPSDEIDFAAWWNHNHKLMQNLGWVDINISKKHTMRYILDNTKINVYFEHSDVYDGIVITIKGVQDEN